MCKKLGDIVQGYSYGEIINEKIYTVRFFFHEDIAVIPKYQTITYARIVASYRSTRTIPTASKSLWMENL